MLVKVIHNNDVAKAVLKQYKAIAKADIKAPDYEHYAGDYLITPEKQSQVLDTENKYVEQDIVIDPIPDNYIDVSDTTATPADVKRNKEFYTADGELTQGELRAYVGNYEITPSKVAQTLQMQNRYCDSDIVLNAIPDEYVDITDTTATPADVLSGKLFHKSDGELVAGNIATYSGVQTVTPSENVQTLATDGKFVIGNIDVNPIPSNYADVSDVTATASDVEAGKYFVTAAGLLTLGTLDKLEYESGTWTPNSNISHGSIAFSNVHTKPPAMVVVQDNETTLAPNDSGLINVFADFLQIGLAPVLSPSNRTRYGACYINSIKNDGTLGNTYYLMQYPYTDPTDTVVGYMRYWATETEFKPYTGDDSRYWHSNRTYKWLAIWV